MNQKMLYFQPTNYEHSETIKKTRQNGEFFQFWQGHLCDSRTNEICDLLQFGKEIKQFLDKYV
jgi:hypothetical protein